MPPSVFDALQARGFVAQVSHQDALSAALAAGPVTFYVGYDPTGPSLHAGHLVTLAAARWLVSAGHQALCLVGGATAVVGDPHGKTEARKELAPTVIADNAARIGAQIRELLGHDGDPAAAGPVPLMLNNADWLRELHAIDFLQDTGRHFRVGRMLASDTYKSRLNEGLTFFEFAYQLLQAYDFSHLCKSHNCRLQLGGDDQWSSILAGTDLCRRRGQGQAFGLTVPLITTANGAKMGKTLGGALWLDAARTPVSDFYQYWVNVADADVQRFLRLFTRLPLADIDALTPSDPAQINGAKSILAYEITAWVHGADRAAEAQRAAASAFGQRTLPADLLPTSAVPRATKGEGNAASLPTHALTSAVDVPLFALLVAVGFAKSNNEARRLVRQGGVTLNGETLAPTTEVLAPASWPKPSALLRAGKKRFVSLLRPT